MSDHPPLPPGKYLAQKDGAHPDVVEFCDDPISWCRTWLRGDHILLMDPRDSGWTLTPLPLRVELPQRWEAGQVSNDSTTEWSVPINDGTWMRAIDVLAALAKAGVAT